MFNSPISHSGDSRGGTRRAKRSVAALSILALTFTTLSGTNALAEEDAGERFTTWTASNGVSLSAELIGSDGRSALLRLEGDGSLYSVPLSRLRESDRERALADDVLRLPELDFNRGPSPAEIGALLQRGSQEGWFPFAAHLQAGLLAAYRGNYRASVQRWYFLYRWIDLFQETPFHADLVPDSGRFGENWPPELLMSVCRDADFSEEFFQLISPHDRMNEVSRILAALHRANPEAFEEYKSLALAIAVVHDQQPPADWHSGVPDGLLPSNLMPPEDTFAFFVSSHRAGRLLMDPRRIPARKLKFMVDLIAPEEELLWAQQTIRPGVGQFDRAYSSVPYDQNRVRPNLRGVREPWPHDDYRLQTLRRQGGISEDRAYFAMQVGKALGLPTVYFWGYGETGSHAWFGYYRGETRGWDLDAGRHLQNDSITGNALDPQTWRTIDNHELDFRDNRLHRTRDYEISLFHSAFAREFRLAGRESNALAAIRRGLDVEPRNRDAWDLAAAIRRDQGRTKDYENTLSLAADAFRQQPHIRAHYRGLLLENLLEQQAFSEAFNLMRQIIQETMRDRPGLSVRYARRFLEHARDRGDADGLVDGYRQVVSQLRGHVTAFNFINDIAVPFLNHLHEQGRTNDARQLLNQTRRQFNPPRDTPAAKSLDDLNQTLR